MSIAQPPQTPQKGPRMRLAEFILTNVEPILAEWETFACTVWPAPASTDPAQLRDHAEAILRATVQDMRSVQSVAQQVAKSTGHGHDHPAGRRLDSASDLHGAGRVDSGFKLPEVLAEYRALRASVVRLWRKSMPEPDVHDIDDLSRFHESIDQSLATAVASYTDRVDHARQLFLAILGHDLRNPLNAMMLSAQVIMGLEGAGPDVVEMAEQVRNSSAEMGRLVADLLDFTAAGFGGGMPLKYAPTDLARLCADVVHETRLANPGCAVALRCDGELDGQWDAARLRQVLSNLLGNSVQHGGADACGVDVVARADGDTVVLSVHNSGDPIPPAALPTIFDPLRRIATVNADIHGNRRPGSMGLGLFIVRQVVTSHGGTIEVTSSATDGTTFTVHLPRHPGRAPNKLTPGS
jgi:signal transduction histidine kinase